MLIALGACDGKSSSDVDRDAAAGTDASTSDSGGTGGTGASCDPVPERNGPYTRLTVAGDPGSALGLIDPSVEYAATEGLVYMTYTAVPSQAQVHIAIASSADAGATWQYVGNVTPPAPPITVTTTDDTVCGAASCTGFFAQESSSLLIDPSDPDPARRFKVLAHTYFYNPSPVQADDETRFEIGYIALYTSASASGPWTETRLFGWPSSSPTSNDDVAYDIGSHPALTALRDCVIVGEPGALVRESGTIDLALSCPSMSANQVVTTDIRLLRSTDHGISWTYVGVVLSAEDGPMLHSTSNQITGGDLFYANGGYHLIATPFGMVDVQGSQFEGYRGCVVVPISDLDAGEVSRCDGAPIIEASYLGQPGQFVGACSADANAAAAGMLIPVPDLTFSSPQIWQIFTSGLPLP